VLCLAVSRSPPKLTPFLFAGRARDEEPDDLLMENPNHRGGAWHPHHEEESSGEEEESDEEQEEVDTLAETLEKARVE
jgi:hypothetical protein